MSVYAVIVFIRTIKTRKEFIAKKENERKKKQEEN